jgi:hypothetical protein
MLVILSRCRIDVQMSSVAEIEAALPALTLEGLRQLECALRRIQSERVQSPAANPRLAAFDALQRSLALDDEKARGWEQSIREARR